MQIYRADCSLQVTTKYILHVVLRKIEKTESQTLYQMKYFLVSIQSLFFYHTLYQSFALSIEYSMVTHENEMSKKLQLRFELWMMFIKLLTG